MEEVQLVSSELEKRIEKIKKRIFDWFKEDNLNIYLVLVLIFAFAIRLYYFIQVGNQPLWWDEAVYGALAKNFISNMWGGTHLIQYETMIRPLFLPFIWSLLMRIGIPEMGARFFLEFIPSIISVFLVYLIGKEIFEKRVGIISAFIFSVLWIHLFYTVRLLTNVPALVFLFLSIYLFIKSTKYGLNYKFFSLALIFLSFSTLTRYPNGIIFFVYVFMLLINKQFLLNKLKFWYFGLMGISPILLFFLYNFMTQENIFPALLGGQYINAGEKITTPFAFGLLNYIPIYLQTTFFIFFILGTIILLFELFVGYNLIPKTTKLKNSLLLFLILISVYSFFIFYLRAAEDRYFFPICISLCVFTGFGINLVYGFIKKHNKFLAISFLLLVLFLGAYVQISQATNLIENKKTSFLQERQGFEWMDKNTPKSSIYAGSGIAPYVIYYTSRNYYELPSSSQEIGEDLNSDYLILQIFHNSPEYFAEYFNNNFEKWKTLQIFYLDEEKKQPAFIIYRKVK